MKQNISWIKVKKEVMQKYKLKDCNIFFNTFSDRSIINKLSKNDYKVITKEYYKQNNKKYYNINEINQNEKYQIIETFCWQLKDILAILLAPKIFFKTRRIIKTIINNTIHEVS